MENVLQIHTEAVSAQIAHFYEVCILIIALLGPVERQTSYTRLTYFTSQLPLCNYRVTIDPVSLSFSHEGVTTSINLVQLQKNNTQFIFII